MLIVAYSAGSEPLQLNEVQTIRASNRRCRKRLIERDQTTTMYHGKCQKVDIRELPVSVHGCCINERVVEQAYIIR